LNAFDEVINRELESSLDLHGKVFEDRLIWETLAAAAISAADSVKAGGKIIFAGNGGSFADAQHLAAEFIGNMGVPRPSLPSVALGTNLSSVTAIGNDFDFNDIFLREFSAIGDQRDFLILISTSGNSRNLLSVGKYAQKSGINGLVLTGKSGGQIMGIFPTILVPHNRTERIQEIHILLGHIFCELVELSLGYRN
jgi:D-sedoheptulose 7-phosphate isomerase